MLWSSGITFSTTCSQRGSKSSDLRRRIIPQVGLTHKRKPAITTRISTMLSDYALRANPTYFAPMDVGRIRPQAVIRHHRRPQTKPPDEKKPANCLTGFSLLRITSLTITYFHTGCSTIIGAKLFHGPVRDGKGWDQLAMVIRHNLYWHLSPVGRQSLNLEEAKIGVMTGSINKRTTLYRLILCTC